MQQLAHNHSDTRTEINTLPYSSLRCPLCHSGFDTEVSSYNHEYGIITCSCSEYPIVEGIIVLNKQLLIEKVVALIKAERFAEAFQVLAPNFPYRSDSAIASFKREGTGALGPKTFKDFLIFYLQDKPTFDYFYYKFSQPRHLIALSYLRLLRNTTGPLLDFGCGLGHLLFKVQQFFPNRSLYGIDKDFLSLFAAKTYMNLNSALICTRPGTPLPFEKGALGGLISSDVYHLLLKKAFYLEEFNRVVAATGISIIGNMRNSLSENYLGLPLAPSEYSELFAPYPHRICSDRICLDRYLMQRGPALALQKKSVELDSEHALTAVFTKETELYFRDWDTIEPFPHYVGSQSPNPFFNLVQSGMHMLEFQPNVPKDEYLLQHPGAARYLYSQPLDLHLDQYNELLAGKNSRKLVDYQRACLTLHIPDSYCA